MYHLFTQTWAVEAGDADRVGAMRSCDTIPYLPQRSCMNSPEPAFKERLVPKCQLHPTIPVKTRAESWTIFTFLRSCFVPFANAILRLYKVGLVDWYPD